MDLEHLSDDFNLKEKKVKISSSALVMNIDTYFSTPKGILVYERC